MRQSGKIIKISISDKVNFARFRMAFMASQCGYFAKTSALVRISVSRLSPCRKLPGYVRFRPLFAKYLLTDCACAVVPCHQAAACAGEDGRAAGASIVNETRVDKLPAPPPA
jgi:hypothetical protein